MFVKGWGAGTKWNLILSVAGLVFCLFVCLLCPAEIWFGSLEVHCVFSTFLKENKRWKRIQRSHSIYVFLFVSVSLPRIRRCLPLLPRFHLAFMLRIRYLGEVTNVLGLNIIKKAFWWQLSPNKPICSWNVCGFVFSMLVNHEGQELGKTLPSFPLQRLSNNFKILVLTLPIK